MSNEIVTIEHPQEIQQTPAQLARRMDSVVEQARKIVAERHVHDIQGKKYVDVAGLTYTAALMGLTVAAGEPERVEIGGIGAFRVRAEVLHNGRLVSSGYGLVGDDEGAWRNRPMFAKAAMASTRAAGRALRMLLSPAIVAMGYEATPMEEMPREESHEAPRRQVENTAKREPEQEAPRQATNAPKEWRDEKADRKGKPKDTGRIVSVTVKKEGTGSTGKPYKLFAIKVDSDGRGQMTLDTFSDSAADVCAALREAKSEIEFCYEEKQNGKYTNYTLLSVNEALPF